MMCFYWQLEDCVFHPVLSMIFKLYAHRHTHAGCLHDIMLNTAHFPKVPVLLEILEEIFFSDLFLHTEIIVTYAIFSLKLGE